MPRWTALARAVATDPVGRKDLIEMLLEQRADASIGREPALVVAARTGPYPLERVQRTFRKFGVSTSVVVRPRIPSAGAT